MLQTTSHNYLQKYHNTPYSIVINNNKFKNLNAQAKTNEQATIIQREGWKHQNLSIKGPRAKQHSLEKKKRKRSRGR